MNPPTPNAPPVETQKVSPLMQDVVVQGRAGWALLLAFLVAISVPSLHQGWVDLHTRGHWRVLEWLRSSPTRDSFHELEENVGRRSSLAFQARTFYRTAWMVTLGGSAEAVIMGDKEFLFYRPEVEMAASDGMLARKLGRDSHLDGHPKPTPLGSIVDFNQQLQRRGIHLVMVFVPFKPSIYPEYLRWDYPVEAGPAWKVDRKFLSEKLKTNGVDVVDVTDDLWSAKPVLGDEIYLKLDSHWGPRAMERTADRLSAHIRPLLRNITVEPFTTSPLLVSNYGDLVFMTSIPPRIANFKKQSVQVHAVYRGQELARGQDSAAVLLLGDSYSMIYSNPAVGWSEGAGLAEQLMLRLQTEVQLLAEFGGKTDIRKEITRRPQVLGHKQVVIWELSERALYDEATNWDFVPLPPSAVP